MVVEGVVVAGVVVVEEVGSEMEEGDMIEKKDRKNDRESDRAMDGLMEMDRISANPEIFRKRYQLNVSSTWIRLQCGWTSAMVREPWIDHNQPPGNFHSGVQPE